MIPISPQVYRGIRYVHLDNLPKDQRSQLNNWMPTTEYIKIKIAEDVIDHCVNYQDYLYWYENFYSEEEKFASEI